jgi:adenylate kinase
MFNNRAGGLVVLRRVAEPMTRTPASSGQWSQCVSRSASASALSPAAVDNDRSNNTKQHRSSSSSSSSRLRLNTNLSLFGPPGSGKGSYGKHFAKTLKIPLVTTSDVLRKLRPDLVELMSDGKLVDDEVVGEALLEGLQLQLRVDAERGSNSPNSSSNNNHGHRGYILDGFPRTLRQVALMEDTWPESLQLDTVVHLGVPDFVCSSKLLGRRACSKCGKSYNVHGVDEEGWHMPPHLPPKGHVCESSSSSLFAKDVDTSCDWSVRREDDTHEIMGERLRVYHQNADPILDYIRNNNNNNSGGEKNKNHHRYRLLTLKPYRGFDDLPGLVEKLRKHVGGG